MLLDEEEVERRLLERREVARAFKAQRKEVENRREQDRLDRNAAKERQLQEAEELQVMPGTVYTGIYPAFLPASLPPSLPPSPSLLTSLPLKLFRFTAHLHSLSHSFFLPSPSVPSSFSFSLSLSPSSLPLVFPSYPLSLQCRLPFLRPVSALTLTYSLIYFLSVARPLRTSGVAR